jgi:hypothetical protein
MTFVLGIPELVDIKLVALEYVGAVDREVT